MSDREVDIATQRLIERLILEDIEDDQNLGRREALDQLRDEELNVVEEEDLQEALRLSRALYEEENLRRITGGHDRPAAESSRAGAVRERNEAGERHRDHHARPGSRPETNRQRANQRNAPDEPSEGECVICAESFPTRKLIRPEGCPETEPRHYYCEDCMKMAFKGALRDEALFPVRCCPAAGPFEISQIRQYFDRDFQERFSHREAELKSRDRIYCHRPACSTFIAPENVRGDEATCRECRKHTCARCKKAYHPGQDCPEEDKETKETIELGKTERWQRCPFCKDLVDLHSGCNHIFCRCGHEFCFLCAAAWKTCDCPMIGLEHIPPEEQDRRDAVAARRFHEDEMAQWEIDRQFEGDMPQVDAGFPPDFIEPAEPRGRDVFPRDMPPIEPRAQPVFDQQNRRRDRDVHQREIPRAIHRRDDPERRRGRNAFDMFDRPPRRDADEIETRPPWMRHPFDQREDDFQRGPDYRPLREFEGERMDRVMERFRREAPRLWAQEQMILAQQRLARMRRDDLERRGRRD